MSNSLLGIFDFSDNFQVEVLNHRLRRNQVVNANIANSETPGYRALGYDFEEQLQAVAEINDPIPVKVTNGMHRKHNLALANGSVTPDVFVRPTESIGHDGNTVDVDEEMAKLTQNDILYRTALETINRKIGLLKYAITGGR